MRITQSKSTETLEDAGTYQEAQDGGDALPEDAGFEESRDASVLKQAPEQELV